MLKKFALRKNRTLLVNSLLILCSTLLFSACGVSARPARPHLTPKPGVSKEVIHLAPADGFDQTGTATIEDLGGGKVHVFIRIDHSADAVLPASLNDGDCSQIGGVKHPLQDVQNQNSDTILSDVAMTDVQTLAVVVYHPKGDSRATVCGIIQ